MERGGGPGSPPITVQLSERTLLKLQQLRISLFPQDGPSDDQVFEMGLDALAEKALAASPAPSPSPGAIPALVGVPPQHTSDEGGPAETGSNDLAPDTAQGSPKIRRAEGTWSGLPVAILAEIWSLLDWAPAHISLRPRLVCTRWAEACAAALPHLTRANYIYWDEAIPRTFPALQSLRLSFSKVAKGDVSKVLTALIALKKLKLLAIDFVHHSQLCQKDTLAALCALQLEEIHVDVPGCIEGRLNIPCAVAAGPVPLNMSICFTIRDVPNQKLAWGMMDAMQRALPLVSLSVNCANMPGVPSPEFLGGIHGLTISLMEARSAANILGLAKSGALSSLQQLSMHAAMPSLLVNSPNDLTQNGMENLTSLVSLEIDFGHQNVLMLDLPPSLTCLTTLRLKHVGDTNLSKLQVLESLKDLELSFDSREELTLEAMESVASLTALTRLCLYNTDHFFVAPLTALQNLRLLKLPTQCRTCDLDRLIGIIPRLYHLCLRNTGVTDSTLEALISGLPSLTVLDCGGCEALTSAGVCMAIAAAPPLFALGLPPQVISWEVTQVIASLPLLRHVYVSRPESVEVSKFTGSPHLQQWMANAMSHIVDSASSRAKLENIWKEETGEMLAVRTLVYELLEQEMAGKFRERPYYNGHPARPDDWEDWWTPDDDSDTE